MRTLFTLAALASLPMAPATALPSTTSLLPEAQSGSMRADLARVVADSDADARIPVTIVLREQVDSAELTATARTMSKDARRAYVVETLRSTADATQGALLEFLGQNAESVTDLRPLWIRNVVCAKLTPSLIEAVAQRSDVDYIARDVHVTADEVLVSAPIPGGTPTCGLNLIGAPQVWSTYGVNGTGVVVGVIDTGLCGTHNDIKNRRWTNPGEIPANGIDDDGNGFVDDINGWNFEGNNSNTSDVNGHGSHVSGTVAGDGTNGTQCGVAPGASIMTLKFFNSFSGESSVWNSMQYGLANGADVLTASLGWPHFIGPDRPTWRATCENVIAGGVIVIYAAGNEGAGSEPDNVRTPGDVPDVLTVGAVACNDVIAGFSSRGPVTWQGIAPYNDHPYPPGLVKPDVCAEGASTISHSLCSGYVTFSGTSMATPHVAGAVALLLQVDPTLDQFGVKALLEGTAVDLGAAGKDNTYGSGRLDMMAAIAQAIAGSNFCEPKATSCGTTPLIWTEGAPSATSGTGFRVMVESMPGAQPAMVAYTDQGAANIPLLGGHLCIQGPKRTVPIVLTGTAGACDGTASFDMNAFAAGTLGGFPAGFLTTPGITVHAQYWSRDPANTFGSVLSGGTSYTIAP